MNPALLHHIVHHLAAASTTIGGTSGHLQTGSSQFWSTTIGGLIGPVLSAVGWIVVIFALIKGGFDVYKGKLSSSFKVLLGALLFGAIMIYPALIGDIISFFATVVHKLIGSANHLTHSSTANKVTTTSATTTSAATSGGFLHLP